MENFLKIIQADARLTVWHISLCLALYRYWLDSGRQASFSVSRRGLMKLAHIKSLMTYHKLIRELQMLGYISYRPSYHPAVGSVVGFNTF